MSFEAKAEQTLAAKGLKTDSTDFDSANFEMKNEGKRVTEILSGLDMPQKYFIMRELKVFFLVFEICLIIWLKNIKELAEPELKVMLSANPKLSLEILKMQKELGLDNTQQFEKVIAYFNSFDLPQNRKKSLKHLWVRMLNQRKRWRT